MDSEPQSMARRRFNALLLGGATIASPAYALPQLDFWPFSRRTARAPLLIAGSGVMSDLSVALVKAYSKIYPHVDAVVERGGSMSALIALKRGAVDVAAMTRDLREADDEKGVRNYLIARNAVGVAVHPRLGISNLSRSQLRAIFDGKLTHWSQVGGPNWPIRVITRKPNTPARQFLEEVILNGEDVTTTVTEMETPAQVLQAVQSDETAVGYILLRDRDASDVRFLSVDAIPPARETILSARYPLTQSFYYVLARQSGRSAEQFVEFAQSASGQAIVDAQHLVGTY